MTSCPDHPDHPDNYYCLPCNKSVCQTCVDDSHTQHEVQRTEIFISEKRKQVQNFIKRAKDETLPSLTTLLDTNTRCMETYSMAVTSVKADVQRRMTEIKTMADQILQEELKRIDEKMNHDMSIFTEKDVEIKSQIEKAKEILTRNTDTEDFESIIQKQKELKEVIDVHLDEKLPLSCKFSPSSEDPYKVLHKLLGNFQEQKNPNTVEETGQLVNEHRIIKSKIINTVSTRRGHKITSVCQSSSNEVLVAYSSCSFIDHYDMNGRKLKSRKVSTGIQDMASNDVGVLFVTFNNGHQVFKLEREKSRSLIDFSPYTTLGICLVENELIVVCLWYGEKGKIVKISQTGKIVEERYQAPTGEELFIKPYRLVLSNCDLIVADTGRKEVLAVDDTSNIKFCYNGGSERGSFIPIGLACDNQNHVVIANWKGNSLHLIDKQGNLLTLIIEQKHNMLYPFSLMLDMNRILWVGHKDNISKVKYSK